MKKVFILLMAFVFTVSGYAQQKNTSNVDLAATVGASQGSGAFSYLYNWRLGKKKKFEIGVGGRLTSYFGSKKDFISSGPAKYTRTFTTPFLIFFAGQQESNFDTLQVQRPQTNSLNAMVNLGYNFNTKWYAGFNIDVIGFTFGRKSGSVFTRNGSTTTDVESTPAAFNLLLTGDHDKGSLNSEFYVRYQITPRLGLRGIYQFLFVEYEGGSVKQTYPDGKTNNLFRNKSNNFGVGLTYFLQ